MTLANHERSLPTDRGISDARPAVAMAAASLLAQCEAFVSRFSGMGDAYSRESRSLKGGSIGKHVRHTLDHFRAALDAHETGGAICYDRRERDVPMESRPDAALDAIASLRARLARLSGATVAAPVRVRVMLSGDGEEADLDSSLGRELAFATHHAIHHHAMMGAIAAEFGVEAPEGFGLAPSTIRHLRGSTPE